MARLSVLGTAVFTAAGVVAATALLPTSSWSFRNQLSIISNPVVIRVMDPSEPSARVLTIDDSKWDKSKREESLARAFLAAHNYVPPPPNSDIPFFQAPWFVALSDHEKRFPQDVEALAARVRFICRAPMVRPANEIPRGEGIVTLPSTDRNVRRKTEIAKELLRVSTIGEKLEPENLFWAYCRMMALNVLGRLGEARILAYHGAQLRRFEDHALAEGDVLIRTVERHEGYRGEAFRTNVLGWILLPHLASIKATVPDMISRCPPEEILRLKWALYRMQYVIARDGNTFISMLVGISGMESTLAKRDEFQSSEKNVTKREAERRRFFLSRASRFASELQKAHLLKPNEDPVKMLQHGERLKENGAVMVALTEQQSIFSNLAAWSTIASKGLLGFFTLLMAIPGVLIWSRRSPAAFDQTRGTLPLAFGVLFLAISTIIQPDSIDNSLPLILLTPVLALVVLQVRSANTKKVAIGFVVCTLIAATFAYWLNGPNAAGFTIALMALAWAANRWSWPTIIFGLLTAAACTVSLRWPEFTQMGILQMIPLLLISGCLLSIYSARWVANGAAITVFALMIFYGYAVSRDVAANAELKQFNMQFVTEADRVRDRAGLPRLSSTDSP